MVILNLQKPFEQSFRFLAEIKAKAPKVEVIFVSPFDEETRWLWIDAIRSGAYEFLPKPLDVSELKRVLLKRPKSIIRCNSGNSLPPNR